MKAQLRSLKVRSGPEKCFLLTPSSSRCVTGLPPSASSFSCSTWGGARARVTIDQFRHLALRTFYGHMVFTNISTHREQLLGRALLDVVDPQRRQPGHHLPGPGLNTVGKTNNKYTI